MGLPKRIHEREMEKERRNMEHLTRFRNWWDDFLDKRGIIRKVDLQWDCSCGVGRIGSS